MMEQQERLNDLLNLFNNQYSNLSKLNIKKRKKYIINKNSIYFYTQKSGMSSMLYYYMQQRKQRDFLYIDKNDILLLDISLKELILCTNKFAINNNILTIIVDNITQLEEIQIDHSLTYILCSTIENKHNISEIYINFLKVNIYPLDYSEYKYLKKITKTNVFNLFIKDNSFIDLISNNNVMQRKNLQNIINSFFIDTQIKNIFYLYLQYQAKLTTIHFLFKRFKERYKLSKDKFYSITRLLLDSYMIFFIPHVDKIKSGFKIYFIDHNMTKALQINNNIKNSLENAILLELIKKDYDVNKIFYCDDLTFILPNKKVGITLMIFKELEEIIEHIWYLDAILKEYYLETIYIITIDEETKSYEKTIQNTTYKVCTFWDMHIL
jgi:hypothetical protein